jgi:hypothetical protein
MLTPTDLPTDNFYKFCAIAGIAVLLTCIVVFTDRESKLREQTLERNLMRVELKVKAKWLARRVSSLEALIDNSIKD